MDPTLKTAKDTTELLKEMVEELEFLRLENKQLTEIAVDRLKTLNKLRAINQILMARTPEDVWDKVRNYVEN